MATQRQIAANRANAQHSTGPKSAAGRKASSQNARGYGLSSPGTGQGAMMGLDRHIGTLDLSQADDGTHVGVALPAPGLPQAIAQTEAWLARIRARLREIDDRIDQLIAAGAFKRDARVEEGAVSLQQLVASDAVPAAVRAAAQKFLMEPGIAAILDPFTALFRERALLVRYRGAAEAMRRNELQGGTGLVR